VEENCHLSHQASADGSARRSGRLESPRRGLLVVLLVLLAGCSSEAAVDSDDAAFRPAMELDRPTCKVLAPTVQLDWKEGETRFGYRGPEDEPPGGEATEFERDLERLGFTELETRLAGGVTRAELRKNYEDREIDAAIQRVQEAVASSPDCS
jgi:hypothetical protein